ncbi:unnamed protein product [Auanema sp. JU1783]|nr:unnamed protein product [Auanema sp. JU1783]
MTKLLVCLCFGINVLADILETSSNSALISALNTPERLTEKLCDKDDELAKISCLSLEDLKELWNGIFPPWPASTYGSMLFRETFTLIGLEELRKTLNLPPPRLWAPYNSTEPSKEELESAPTLEAYFNLKEPEIFKRSYYSLFFYEHNFVRAMNVLDKHAPVIRAVFRCKFEMIRSLDEERLTERQKIDRMIAELSTIKDKLNSTIELMFYINCRKDELTKSVKPNSKNVIF